MFLQWRFHCFPTDELGERRKEITELEKRVSQLEPSAENLPKVQAQLDIAMIAKQEIESKAQIMEEQYMTKVNEADEKKEQLENKLKELDAEMNSKLTEVKEQKEKIEEDFLNMRVNKDKEIAKLKEQVYWMEPNFWWMNWLSVFLIYILPPIFFYKIWIIFLYFNV